MDGGDLQWILIWLEEPLYIEKAGFGRSLRVLQTAQARTPADDLWGGARTGARGHGAGCFKTRQADTHTVSNTSGSYTEAATHRTLARLCRNELRRCMWKASLPATLINGMVSTDTGELEHCEGNITTRRNGS